jgi:predicted NAD/FAD-dependent oxidoreductase
MLEPLIRDGLIAPWQARYAEISGSVVTAESRWGVDEPRYVGVPRMNDIGKALAGGVDVRYGTTVSHLERADGHWVLELVDSSGSAGRAASDWVFACVPLPQADTLLAGMPGFTAATGGRKMLGCHALMLGFDARPLLPFDAASVGRADISWIARNSSKPGRGSADTLVVHAANDWSEANLELDAAAVLDHMLSELARVTGIQAGAAVHRAVHRWRYANAPPDHSASHWLDPEARLGAAGDWWIRGRVEFAFESARALLAEFKAVLDR